MAINNNNVIPGPWTNTSNAPATVVYSDILNRSIHIQETLIELMPALFNSIEHHGFHFDNSQVDSTAKDGTLIVEAVKSLLCKYYDMHHPMQEVAEVVFIVDPVGHLDFANTIAITLTPMESIDLVYVDDDDDADLGAVEE